MLTGLPLALWAEAITTAVYLQNSLPDRSIGKSTHYESLYNKKPSINHLRPYWTKCFVHLPEEKRLPGTKLMPRAIERYLIGYTSSDKIYRIYLPSQHKVTEARQIDWTTKTITPLGTTMEPLLAEESYATVYPLSHLIATTTVESLMTRTRADTLYNQHRRNSLPESPLRNSPHPRISFQKYLNNQLLHPHLRCGPTATCACGTFSGNLWTFKVLCKDLNKTADKL